MDMNLKVSLWILFANIGVLLVYIITAIIIYKTLKENRKLAYIQFYEIIKRHHTKEITDLRGEVMRRLESNAKKAKSEKKSLIDIDPDFHSKASALANYYEGVAMFLKGGWEIFPKEVRDTMIEMLHNSVSRTWPLFYKYKDVIYPSRPRDWAQSYQWLFGKVEKYQNKKNL